MSKKKNSPKKHKFKHIDPTLVSQSDSGASVIGAASPVVSRGGANYSQAAIVGTRDFSYVAHDMRRIAIMAGVLVAMELAFYYLLVFTPVGDAVYRLVAF